MVQVCSRATCGGLIQENAPRKVIDGRVYHYYCGWKTEQALKEAEEKKSTATEQFIEPGANI